MLDKLLRRLPDFRGKRRVAGMLMKRKIDSAEDILIEGRYHCRYILPNLKENVAGDIFINGIYEKETIDLLGQLIPLNGRILDLGANIGSILIPLCTNRKDIKAIAVEAAPWIYVYLSKNVELNGLKNVQLVNKALYNQDGLELDFYSPREKFGKGSLSPVFTKEGVKIKTITLDTLVAEAGFLPVDAIKIDVEGFEYFVFKGGAKLLAGENAPAIVFEFVDWAERAVEGIQPGAAQRLLLDFGYTLYKTAAKNKLVPVDGILEEGSYNLVASKKPPRGQL